jgi:hypothetical protein
MSSSALAAAIAVAREQGIRCDEAFVLRDAWHVLVHLRPSPVVARISTPLPFPEGANQDDIAREVAVAAHCADAGCAVVPPIGNVTYQVDGHVVSLWEYVEPYGDPDPEAALRALRAIHDALESYEGSLPEFGHPSDVEAMLDALPPSDDVELLRSVTANRPDVKGQPLHGDAHVFNVLGSPRGPLWHDFETACHGPREYDLAAFSEDAPIDAYGAYDRELVEAMRPYYDAWVAVSMLTALPRRPQLAQTVVEILRQLRER